jgi:hypothetical protein
MITAEETPAGTLLRWSEVAGARSYTVVRGRVGSVRQTEYAIDVGETACIESRSLDASTAGNEDHGLPAPGQAFFYLVAYDDGSDSSYGTESTTKPRSTSSGDCR